MMKTGLGMLACATLIGAGLMGCGKKGSSGAAAQGKSPAAGPPQAPRAAAAPPSFSSPSVAPPSGLTSSDGILTVDFPAPWTSIYSNTEVLEASRPGASLTIKTVQDFGGAKYLAAAVNDWSHQVKGRGDRLLGKVTTSSLGSGAPLVFFRYKEGAAIYLAGDFCMAAQCYSLVAQGLTAAETGVLGKSLSASAARASPSGQ